MKFAFFLAFTSMSVVSLGQDTKNDYAAEIEAWHLQRIAALKRADGWLNLVGLYWLHEGRNSFGSSAKNEIVFPKGKIAPEAGYFEVTAQTVTVHANPAAHIHFEGKEVAELIQFDGNAIKDRQLQCGSLHWTIIRRKDKLGIRLRDDQSKTLLTFKDTERFPADPQFRFGAVFDAGDTTRKISIRNQIGQDLQEGSPGSLLFSFQGKEYRLDALDEGKDILIVFGDRSSGKETYGGGRFITLKKPMPGERVTLDFNKSYNPPCVFTPYATCPLPPPQNRLPFAVRAGEKTYGHH